MPTLLTEDRCCARVRTCMPMLETRSALLDNFKGICSLLVVYQHSFDTDIFALGIRGMAPTPAGKLAGGLMAVSIFVSMPGFSFVSGFLSTSKPKRKQLLGNVRLFLTYLIQHLLWLPMLLPLYRGVATAERNTAAGIDNNDPPKTFPLMFFTVNGVDWYILALVVWRAFLPMMATLRFAVPIAFALSIASFFLDVSSVDQAQVVFAFMPYFLVGFRYKDAAERQLKKMRNNCLASLAFPLFASVCMLSAFVVPVLEAGYWVNCFYGGIERDMGAYPEPRAFMNISALPHLHMHPDRHCMTSLGVAESVAFFAISGLGVASLLLSLPDRPVILLTKAGENAIYIYLTHSFFITALMMMTSGLAMSDEQAIVVSIVGCVYTWAFLATGWISYCCSPCVEPPVECCANDELDGP